MTLRLKDKIALSIGCLFVFMLLEGFVHFYVDTASQEKMEQQVKTSSLLRKSMDADMMHDAIRSDVLAFLKARYMHDAKGEKDALNDYAEHKKSFFDNVSAVHNQATDPAIRNEYGNILNVIAGYFTAAEKVLKSPAQANMADSFFPEFQSVFEDLEKIMAGAGDKLEAFQKEVAVDNESFNQSKQKIFLLVKALSIFLALYVGYIVLYKMITPLNALVKSMIELSHNNTEVDIPFTERQDEVGDIGRSLQVFKNNALEVSRQSKEKLTLLSNQRKELSEKVENLILNLEQEMGASMKALEEDSSEVASTVGSLQALIKSLGERAKQAEDNTRKAASNADTTRKTSTGLHQTLSEVCQGMDRGLSLVTEMTGEIGIVSQHVSELTKTTKKIEAIVDLISNVAGQTNLLALNATIESARAGEAGKGFAVVASEVKGLANQTTESTGEIAAQIQAIQASVSLSSSATEQVVTRMQQVQAAFTELMSCLTEQVSSTLDMQASAQESSDCARYVAKDIQEITDSTSMLYNSLNTFERKSSDVLSKVTELQKSSKALIARSFEVSTAAKSVEIDTAQEAVSA
ncbi:MAG: methyl-accepting chemotaxis protein [Alphaproteobacteria bacterium]|jgi:methyl-accepting chemotaxis protein|nr:methyl-accepting chemotaxis protein [Alphaproteobacteria bacterium]